MDSAGEAKTLTCSGFVVTELAHELCDVEDCVWGGVDAVAGGVAAAAKTRMSRTSKESRARLTLQVLSA